MFYFDPLWLLFSIPPLLLGFWAQMRVKSAFAQYSKVRTTYGHQRRAGGPEDSGHERPAEREHRTGGRQTERPL